MATQYPGSGPNDASQYVVSGIPWVTGSTIAAGVIHLSFPGVTKFLTVRNISASGSQARVAFTQNGLLNAQRNYIALGGGESLTLDLRVKDLYLSSTAGAPTVEVIAGLTTISYSAFPVLTGSTTGSVFSGVG